MVLTLSVNQLTGAAGLPGSYKAWLSDGTGSPSSRFVRSNWPYQLVNRATVAASWAALTNADPTNALLAPINVTETGEGPGATTRTWPNTEANGTLHAGNERCNNWQSGAVDPGRIGFSNFTSVSWSDADTFACYTQNHFYCFQQS